MAREATGEILLPRAAVDAERRPCLVVTGGAALGRAFRLTKAEAIVGRNPEADIVLPHRTVSWRHAVIQLAREAVVVEDLGSRNGTFIGVDKVKRRALADGDLLGIGDATILKLTYAASLGDVLQRAAYDIASRDPNTEVASLPCFLDRLRTELAHARRHRTPVTLMWFRVDGLGGPGDVTGESAEETMREAAAIIRRTMRAEEILARSGLDELVTAVRAPPDSAEVMGARIRLQFKGGATATAFAQRSLGLTVVISTADTALDLAADDVFAAVRDAAKRRMAQVADQIVRLDPPPDKAT